MSDTRPADARMSSEPSSPLPPEDGSMNPAFAVTDLPKFDLETYLAQYSGRTRWQRLMLIGLTSTIIGVDALRLAVKEAKAGDDVRRYYFAQSQLKLHAPADPYAERDEDWAESKERSNAERTLQLENQLKGYKQNLVKESTRIGNFELGQHYWNIGELVKASTAFSAMRADVSLPKHVVEISLNLIMVAVEQKNAQTVFSNVSRIRGTSMPAPDKTVNEPILRAADGLAKLAEMAYDEAAHSFLKVPAGMGSEWNQVISPNDIAIYGGLLALATMNRDEMQRCVLDSPSFRTYLELEPHIRRAIGFFVNSRYAQCLAVLESYRSDYLLDIHLQKHVQQIYHRVRAKCIVQYFIPFSCVTLDSMDEAFGIHGGPVDQELVKMIEEGYLNAKIDTINRLLIAPSAYGRRSLQNSALDTAKTFEREARRRIQLMNICIADLEVKMPKGANQPPHGNLFQPNMSVSMGNDWDTMGDFTGGTGMVRDNGRNDENREGEEDESMSL